MVSPVLLSQLSQPLQSKGRGNSIASLGQGVLQGMQLKKQFDAADQKAELTDLKIKETQQILEDQNLTGKMRRYAHDLIGINSSLQAGDLPGVMSGLQTRLERIKARDPEADTQDTEALIRLAENNPRQLSQVIESELGGLAQQGILKFDANGDPFAQSTKMYKNGTVVQASGTGGILVTGPDGKIAQSPEEREKILANAYRDENAKIKSQEEIDQILDLENAKHQITVDDEKRALEMEALENRIATGELKIAEGQEKQEKAAGIKQDMKRLVDDLLSNTDGVENFVGPVDDYLPKLFPKTLEARTKIEQLKAILTSQNLGIMTGVLSESDLKVIAAIAGGGLDIRGSDEAFIKELERMSESLARETAQQQPPTPGLTPEEQKELEELQKLEAEGKL